jgi:hypothetical protein
MENLSDERSELMGNFHNAVVVLVDSSKLTPSETIMVLRLLTHEIERVFELSVKGA